MLRAYRIKKKKVLIFENKGLFSKANYSLRAFLLNCIWTIFLIVSPVKHDVAFLLGGESRVSGGVLVFSPFHCFWAMHPSHGRMSQQCCFLPLAGKQRSSFCDKTYLFSSHETIACVCEPQERRQSGESFFMSLTWKAQCFLANSFQHQFKQHHLEPQTLEDNQFLRDRVRDAGHSLTAELGKTRGPMIYPSASK